MKLHRQQELREPKEQRDKIGIFANSFHTCATDKKRQGKVNECSERTGAKKKSIGQKHISRVDAI